MTYIADNQKSYKFSGCDNARTVKVEEQYPTELVLLRVWGLPNMAAGLHSPPHSWAVFAIGRITHVC